VILVAPGRGINSTGAQVGTGGRYSETVRVTQTCINSTSAQVGMGGRYRNETSDSDLHHFFLFALAHLFHLLDFVVGELLDLLERLLLVVFGDLLVL
jgi:hypothetical protein